MKQVILIVLILVGLSSCSSEGSFPILQDLPTIKAVETWNVNTNLCKYSIATKHYNSIENVIWNSAFFCQCGKFTVGDTVKIIKY